jgi:protein SCO1/2
MGYEKMKRRSAHLICTIILLLFFTLSASSEAKGNYKTKIADYKIPDVTLVNQDGEKIKLTSLLNGDKPVLLDFIYATCTTICPILSVGFSHFQVKMGIEADKVQLVSISIDPDNDTPEIMREYLQRYKSQPGWDFLTGKRQDIIQVMKAFDAYVINKMNHYPMTILHAPGSKEWVRIDGLLSVKDLINEYHKLAEK